MNGETSLVGKIAKILIIILAIGAFYYYKKDDILHLLKSFKTPCAEPITYSIGTFDTRFGISKDDFKNTINQAVEIWDGPINKELFKYTDKNPDLTINLEYDTRQKTTQNLNTINNAIGTDKEEFENLKQDYNSLLTDFNQEKINLQNLVSDYKSELADYNKNVSYWNSMGGAPSAEYQKLNSQKEELGVLKDKIDQTQSELNQKVDLVNSKAAELNTLAKKLNLKVGEYNTVQSNIDSEFNEGEYISDASGQKINIYQYDNRNKLLRVLAHELGHALGIEHTTGDPEAIMYYLNTGTITELTPEEITALKEACKIK